VGVSMDALLFGFRSAVLAQQSAFVA